jgi:hypothetical protein
MLSEVYLEAGQHCVHNRSLFCTNTNIIPNFTCLWGREVLINSKDVFIIKHLYFLAR